MGLDMYLYKAKKPSLDGRKVYIYADLQDKYALFEVSDATLPDWLKDLKPFLVKVRCIAEYYDIDKITECFGFAKNAHWCGFGPDGIYFSGEDSAGNRKSVTIPDDKIQQFVCKKKSIFYVTELQEVGYWRKHYELDDKLTKHFFSTRNVVVENCGYYRMTKAAMHIVENYVKKYETEGVFYDPEEIRSLFYHNSY